MREDLTKIERVAKRFARKYDVKPMLYWKLVEMREDDFSYKEIHKRLEWRGMEISYVTTWRWLNKV